MNAFSAAIDAIFADPNMAADAFWQDQATGPLVACRVMTKAPDRETEFGGARLWSDTTTIDVRVAEIAQPRPGDRFLIGTENHLVQGEPARDRERLVWTVDLRRE